MRENVNDQVSICREAIVTIHKDLQGNLSILNIEAE